jgi:DNA excision repair protein ERCC-2
MPQGQWKYFPYPSFKPNQERLLTVAYEAVKQGSHAVVDGASGLGKTAGSLAGALQACRERDLRILYAARTYKELDRVIEELAAISRLERVSGISIRGRAEMCINDGVLRLSRDSRTVMELCSDLVESGKCPYYSRLDEDSRNTRAMVDEFLVSPVAAFSLISRCRERGLCPYEMTRLLLPQVDVVALSYAYVFNRQIRDNFMKKLRRSLSQYVLILDEAHNLPETANEFESDQISSLSIAAAAEEADRYGKANMKRFSEALIRILGRMEAGEQSVNLKSISEEAASAGRVGETLPIFLEESLTFGESIKALLLSKGKVPRSHINRLSEFLLRAVETSERPDFVHIAQITRAGGGLNTGPVEGAVGTGGRDKFQRLEIVSLDPRSSTKEVLGSVVSSISMSGTLENMEAYRQVVGLPENSVKVALPSPFPEENTLFLACKGVSTLYEKRCTEAYSKMVSIICEVVRSTPGNSAIFCSSYEVMDGLLSCGLESALPNPLFREGQKSRSTDHDRMLEEYKSMGVKGGGVLLGVMGGRFSEGEDYPGDEMNSVLIVGVPYPKPTAKVDSQIRYYDTVFPGKGKEYGYIMPAMRKASQAAGRPFRNLDDRGAVVFMDYRYATRYLANFLPMWIRGRIKAVEDGSPLNEIISVFYGGSPTPPNA